MSLPAPRVTITTHTSAGKSTILTACTPIEPFRPFGPNGSGFSLIHTTSAIPASNSDIAPAVPTTTGIPRAPTNGITFCTTDIPPGGAAPMHRTTSLDYIVVLSGEILLGMEDGQEVRVKAGEIIVQRGTMHSWRNDGYATCRMLVALVDAEKVVVKDNGQVLESVAPRPGQK